MKAYLTWGVGYGSKVIAMKNAQTSAGIDKIKINKLPKLEIERCKIIENKKALSKIKGEHEGIVLQNCSKGQVAASLVLGLTEKQIIIGHGKAGGLIKAERIAEGKVKKIIKDKNLKIEGINYHIGAAIGPPKKTYGCAIVALVLVE